MPEICKKYYLAVKQLKAETVDFKYKTFKNDRKIIKNIDFVWNVSA